MSTTNSNGFIKLNDVRLSFPSLFTPKDWSKSNSQFKPPEDARPKYEATFILDKTKHAKEIELINSKIDALALDKKLNRMKMPVNHLCFRDGDLTEREEYSNCYTIKTSSINRFPIVGQDGVTPIAEEDNLLEAGCYVSAYIDLYVYNKHKPIGIGANLKSLQFRKKGERFGAPIQDIDGAFDPIIDEDDDLF